MTARHCAAVARYSREIAIAAGFSEEEQDLVHTAGLLHDIGKFIFPDRILKGDTKLTEEDWQIIKMHPYQGARIVRQIEGYGPVGEIILAHHERIDGKGYPRGLKGEEIPLLSRIISVADTYDVMTARDSYRKPVSSFEAIQELRARLGQRSSTASSSRSSSRCWPARTSLPPRRGRRLRRRAGPREARSTTTRCRVPGAQDEPHASSRPAPAVERTPRHRRSASASLAQLRGGPLRRADVHAHAGAELEARRAG